MPLVVVIQGFLLLQTRFFCNLEDLLREGNIWFQSQSLYFGHNHGTKRVEMDNY